MSFDFESVKQYLSDQYYSKREHLYQSTGVTDKLRPVTTDLNGLIDASLGTGVFILADGTTPNGNATVVAKSASNTPLTLKMAASQTANALKVVDSSDNPLMFVDSSGYIATGNQAYTIVDFGDGGGEENVFDVSHTFSSVSGRFANYGYLYANLIEMSIDDNSSTGVESNSYCFAVSGSTYLTGARVPQETYGLSYSVVGSPSQASPLTVGVDSVVYARAASGTSDDLIGVQSLILNSGNGTVTTGRYFYAREPLYNKAFTTLIGLDVANLETVTAATNRYAIRTQGGQTLHQTGAATTVGLVVQGAASQSADLTQWKNSAGTVLGWVGSDGKAYFSTVLGGSTASGNLTLQSTSNATKGKILFGTSGYDEVNNRLGLGLTSPTAMLEITDNGAAVVGVIIKGAASQTADLTQWKNSGGTALAWVDASGLGYFPTVLGGSTASGTLTLSSTSNATKGKILFGTGSAYDHANDRLGIGTQSPPYTLTIDVPSGDTVRQRLAGNTRYRCDWQVDASGNSHLTAYDDTGAVYKSFAMDGNPLVFNSNSGANVGFWGQSFGSGTKVIFIANATAPSSNPTGGGILYVESGALKYRGSGGTITTIAAA